MANALFNRVQVAVRMRIALRDRELGDRKLYAEIEQVLPQLRNREGVQDVTLVAVKVAPEMPIGMMPRNISGFLPAVLEAEVRLPYLMQVLDFLRDRLFENRMLEITLKSSDGRDFSSQASNPEELDFLMQEAESFFLPSSEK
ncbi:hypothetical protein [Leptolyngbya sp. FACHB-711]|uniref:hypothetical protein n=1 Tax=unclassified Leptolyngbya TaxID=2650499 RepID=UPI0016834910|nr:hypothetical protein [Leptolyngbya sp. FACHB-711]MBD1849269.1 hypothetical protein [Cyanobacteria bacterium FACHB-502]MBD2026821.1 hypothetical protein [Leptolyngbya sp. FACHB-711]